MDKKRDTLPQVTMDDAIVITLNLAYNNMDEDNKRQESAIRTVHEYFVKANWRVGPYRPLWPNITKGKKNG